MGVMWCSCLIRLILLKIKDSDGDPSKRRSQKMKISLFYKPLVIKASIFVFIIVFMASVPNKANASLFSNITRAIVGEPVQASESVDSENQGVVHNSQNIPLLESSIDPDMKNMKDSPYVAIADNEALTATDVFTGKGLESVSSDGMTVYEVKSGDTLSEIAEQFDVSQNTIRWENDISGSKIRVGQKLNILPVTGVKHIVKKGDTLGGIASKYDASLEDMLIYNGISKDDTLSVGEIIYVPNGIIKSSSSSRSSISSKAKSSSSYSSNIKAPAGYYVRPAVGPITSPYGPRKGSFHYGVDIGNKRGTPIVAAASGTVIKVVNYCVEGRISCGGRYGNYIIIQHPNGTKTRYAHLSAALVSTGNKVHQGQLIAKMGNTGHSTGPHLHFEVINKHGSTLRPPIY